MSGTSLDGLDGIIARFDTDGNITVAHRCHHPWDSALRDALLLLAENQPTTIQAVLQLSQQVSEAHVALAADLLRRMDPSLVRAIGMHGQTVWHQPPDALQPGYTLQLGSPSWVAARIGIPVVGDFRLADMSLGGQGAPLAPFAHAYLFAHPHEARAVLNLGGIANLTGLFPRRPVWASDTGPANMLMDDVARHFSGGTCAYDEDGQHAARGRSHPDLLQALLADPFFLLPFPKSTGRERFGQQFSRILHGLSWDDASHVAGLLAVAGVERAVKALPVLPARVIVAGGGALNSWLCGRLAAALAPILVESSQAYGVAPQDLEALAFATLAKARLEGIPANLPSVTGAIRPTLLGVIAGGPIGDNG
jgi:anhydro-N-acetylmuramic acid kinase